MSCPFCKRTDTDGLTCDDDHCRELPTHKSDPFTGKSLVRDTDPAPVTPSKEPRYTFALDGPTFRRLGRAKAGRDNIPGTRIA